MIGALLIAAGLIELIAGSLRRDDAAFAMAAGAVTALAGLLFVVNPETHFFPTVVPIIGWLLVRSLILLAASRECGGSVRTWTAFSAGMDFLLAVLLDRRTVDLDHRGQPVRPDAGAGRELRLGAGGELRGQRPDAARGRELRRETAERPARGLNCRLWMERRRLGISSAMIRSCAQPVGRCRRRNRAQLRSRRCSCSAGSARSSMSARRACRGSSTVRATSSRACSAAAAPSTTAGSANRALLDRRMSLVSWAIFLSVLSAVLVCVLVALAVRGEPDRAPLCDGHRAGCSSDRWPRSAPGSWSSCSRPGSARARCGCAASCFSTGWTRRTSPLIREATQSTELAIP